MPTATLLGVVRDYNNRFKKKKKLQFSNNNGHLLIMLRNDYRKYLKNDEYIEKNIKNITIINYILFNLYYITIYKKNIPATVLKTPYDF